MAWGQTGDYVDDIFLQIEPCLPETMAGNIDAGKSTAVTAGAAVVMDAGTGQVLFAKNQHQSRPIASTTKIMTALLAIECGNLNSVAKVDPRAAGVEGSSIYLRAGEKLSLEELLYGALMRSGNDACVAIAEHVAGREEIFVGWMNYKACLLGLKNTHFSNTNGLPHREHYSSAYDLAVITRYALQNQVFNKIVASKNHVISGPRGQRHLSNSNKMLWSYQGADGVKTGTTNAAGRCLVSSASREGRRLIAVVLHSENRYAESVRLLDYGFTNFTNYTVARGGEAFSSVGVSGGIKSRVAAGCIKDVVVAAPVQKNVAVEKIVLTDREVEAPVKSGQAVGRLLVLVDGDPVAERALIALEDVDRLPLPGLIYSKCKVWITSSLHKNMSF